MLFKILKVTRMFIWRDIILFMNDPIEFVYLHGFSDASTLVYGRCIYIKSVSKAGNIKISLVTLKTRLLPFKKKFSMAHLELLGNFVLAKLINVVYNALLQEIVIRSYYFWSDSMVSLAWIVAPHKEFKLFVENRVIVIRNLIPIERWHYDSTKENVADFITCFKSVDLLNHTKIIAYGGLDQSFCIIILTKVLTTGKMLVSLV